MNRIDVFIPIVAGTLLFILLSFFLNALILLLKERRKQHQHEVRSLKQTYEQALLQAQVEVQESTYRHVAKEIHDNVGQLLSTTKMLMGVTELKLDHVPETLRSANATLSKAIQELRMLSRSLDKEWLEQFNFLDNLETEVARINSSEIIKACLQCDTTIAMKPEEQIILFRIVQEAIQNAVRHAAPSWLKIQIQNGEQLEVTVSHDGRPLPQNFQGMGTTNMQQRARLFGGNVQWQSAEDKTIATISLPLTTNT